MHFGTITIHHKSYRKRRWDLQCLLNFFAIITSDTSISVTSKRGFECFLFFKIISHHIIVCINFQFAFRRTTFIIIQIFLDKPTIDLFLLWFIHRIWRFLFRHFLIIFTYDMLIHILIFI